MVPKAEIVPWIALYAMLVAQPVHAAVVIVKGSNQPILGYLVRQDERSVTLREVLPGGKSRESSFARGNIDELIITVSPERLSTLDPLRLTEYIEYAEELAEKQRDPEARDTALRLYAIVAARGEGPLRRSAMLGLIALATSPANEQKLRAAAYLFDADHDESLLKRAVDAGTVSAGSLTAASDLLQALRLVRQGKGSPARALFDKPAVRNDARQIAGIITLDELVSLTERSQLSNSQLLRVLRAEVVLEELKLGRAVTTERTPDVGNWSGSLLSGGMEPLPRLSLQTLTEFDPTECVFRNGKWVRP